MNAIFLSDQKNDLSRVYAAPLMERLCASAAGENTIFNKADILAEPERFRDVRCIFSTWGMPSFTEAEIREIFPALECIFYAAGSVQHFARPFLRCGVRIFSAWMANAVPVAEYTVAQILLANKGFFPASRLMSAGDVGSAWEITGHYPGNFDTPVGIIGTGAVGALVCRMLKPYRLRILACSLELTEEMAQELGVEISDMETIFRTCQVVSNHLANNAATQGIFRKEHFASMVPYGVFLNTGRGAQVVEPDLAEVLAQRPDLTAVLDVTMPEPPLPESPFYSLPNCVLTPHIAGSSGLEVHRMSEWIAEEFENCRAGKPCRYEVTEAMLRNMA